MPDPLPKLMVLSTALPGSRHGGGVVQQEVLRRYPKDRYVCVATRPLEGWGPGEGLPDVLRGVPRLLCPLLPRWEARGARFSMPVLRAFGFHCVAPRRVGQAVQFGRRHGVQLVWVELQREALVIARQVADGLGVPLVATVWDDPAGWLADGGYDRLSRRLLEGKFREALRAAERISTAGEAMQEAYRREHGVQSVVLRHGFERPAVGAGRRTERRQVIVGFAGSVYGRGAWEAFFAAAQRLSASGRCPPVHLRAFGGTSPPPAPAGITVEHLGWQPADAMLEGIAATDFCYLPYWFEPGKRRHVELSFPNKFETYLAAGRPVLFHGPEYAGIARAVREWGVGLCVHSLEHDGIAETLERMIADTRLRAAFSAAALTAFREEFNARTMVRRFARLIGVDPALLRATGHEEEKVLTEATA